MAEITGYRTLTDAEIAAINAVKNHGIATQRLINDLLDMPEIDARWLAVGIQDLQTGQMAITRDIARPTTF